MRRAFAFVLFLALVTAAQSSSVRFIDAATRLAIDASIIQVSDSHLEISAPGYRVRSLPAFPADDGIERVVVLEPEHPPAELDPDRIAFLHRDDATAVLGFVGDAKTDTALAGVTVTSGDGSSVQTDANGYFQIYLPCGGDGEFGALRFSKPGFQTQKRTEIELSPRGDWTYCIQLERGEGTATFVDRPARVGVSADPVATASSVAAMSPGSNTVSIPRVPTNIRILGTNGVTIYYETLENYCRQSLPAEWIASWANLTGGSNSLNAGAVAVRTYAIGFVNSPRSTNHDICATTSCQVYRPGVTDSRSDRAVNFTAGYVMVNSNNAIPRGLTEYSAENNQLGRTCGDGFTAPTGGCLSDPVCSGETPNGHGRGMCQWGSVRWATGLKFPNRVNNGTTNGAPRQDWEWILNHYYPNLRLVHATALSIGDPVRVIGSSTPLNVRSCPGGTITNGVNCPSIGTRPLGSLGYIIVGPEQIFADGQGYTWWKVRWQNGLEGWSVENYLDRYVPTNTPPLIAAVPDAIIHAGAMFRITNSASDADFPPNTLTFSLPVAPPGVALHPSTGVLGWRSPASSAGTTNNFTVRVTDNGSPPLSASASFRVRVIPPPALSATLIASNTVRLAWTSAAKTRYQVEYADHLSPPTWRALGGIVTASGSTVTFPDTAPVRQRFYRVVIVE